MAEAASEHTDSPRTVDDLFQLLVHVRGILPDTEAKGKIWKALQDGPLQVDYHIRGGARKTQPTRLATPEELRKIEALHETLQEREASQEETQKR